MEAAGANPVTGLFNIMNDYTLHELQLYLALSAGEISTGVVAKKVGLGYCDCYYRYQKIVALSETLMPYHNATENDKIIACIGYHNLVISDDAIIRFFDNDIAMYDMFAKHHIAQALGFLSYEKRDKNWRDDILYEKTKTIDFDIYLAVFMGILERDCAAEKLKLSLELFNEYFDSLSILYLSLNNLIVRRKGLKDKYIVAIAYIQKLISNEELSEHFVDEEECMNFIKHHSALGCGYKSWEDYQNNWLNLLDNYK